MSTDGFRLLMTSTPLWQAPSHPMPVAVKTVYTVMGRSANKWQTVLNATDDLYIARSVMDAANESGQFDRIVLATGKSVNRAPAAQWTTIECALPKPASQFQKLFTQLEQQTANLNPNEKLARIPGAYVLGKKKSQRFLLFLALVLATLNQSVPALLTVCALATLDCFYLASTRPLSARVTEFLNNGRNWGYALLNGYLLLGLLT